MLKLEYIKWKKSRADLPFKCFRVDGPLIMLDDNATLIYVWPQTSQKPAFFEHFFLGKHKEYIFQTICWVTMLS
jgi:hypothetical protein